jgi:hypothetical protein
VEIGLQSQMVSDRWIPGVDPIIAVEVILRAG